MKKKLILRGLLGIPLGITIGYIISIITSLIWAKGYFVACAPILIDYVGSEIGAVILQTVLSGILGASFAASSVIWEIENWSIAKQTGVYFIITAVTMFPIAYVTGWMEHTAVGFLIYFGVFVVIFLVIWFIQYWIWKQRISSINQKIHSEK